MKIALVTLNPTVAHVAHNTDKMLAFVDQAIERGCELIIFPELSLIGYPPRDYLFYPILIEQQKQACLKLKRRSKKIAIVVGGVEKNKKTGRPFFNAAVVFCNGQKYTYCKQLLPYYDVFDECRYFEPGDGPLTLRIGGLKCGFTICEDIWFSDDQLQTKYAKDPLKGYKDKKIDLLINISASPFEQGKHERRVRLLKKISHELGCFVAYVNQVGANDDLIFDGTAFVFGPEGHLVLAGPAFKETLFEFDCPLRKPHQQAVLPVLPEYELINQALQTGIRDYVQKSGFTQVLLGLSGGVDSALVATLAAKALGPQNVLGVLMPSLYSSKGSISDAEHLAQVIGINTLTVPIEPVHRAFETLFEALFGKNVGDLTDQNIQARIRANILMAIANNTARLLLNTSNKSEVAMGYGTLYGDLCGALCVLADLTKTQVYLLCQHLNKERETIPTAILAKPPSAELKPDQKDTDSLPPYPELDPVLENIINQFGSVFVSGEKSPLAHSVFQTVIKNEFKRFQAAPVLKISNKAFGSGRRIPIVAKLAL